ncbi:MAG TPA: TolC family protein [Elusimicrobiota bacterium]|nr:TolC family protein [Elusimicrobiota bacterium]HNG44470.1 TolC family protein [Elusimicrobiota bacterium]
MKKWILVLLFSAAPLWGAESEGVFPTVDELLNRVEQFNPELRAARGEAEAAAARADRAGVWPNPVLGFSKEKIPAGDRMTHWRGEQEIPFPGKPTQERRMGRHEAASAEARARLKTLEFRTEARDLAARLRRSEAVTSLIGQEIESLDALVASLRARLSAGRGGSSGMGGAASGSPAADLFSLEAERGRMENMLREERQEGRAARLRLNQLLDRSLDGPIVVSAPPALLPPAQPLEALLETSKTESPMLALARHERGHARAQRTQAALAWMPDLAVMVDEQKMDTGESGRELGVSLSVPLWISGPGADNREARRHRAAADDAARAMTVEVERQLRTEHAEVLARLESARAYERSIRPAAQSALDLVRRQYESGRGEFARVLDALRSRLAVETEYQEALAQVANHWGMLEEWVGAPLSPAGR